MSTIQYNRKCLTASTCDAEQRRAAIYDYVGAVYGQKGKVKYDGRLTEAERKYAEEMFGKLTEWNLISSYLANAKEIYYRKFANKQPEGNVCTKSSNFHFQTVKKACGGSVDIKMLAAHHGCFFQSALIYSYNVTELDVAAAPEKWVFGIEGSRSALMRKHAPETFGYLFRIAEALNIPVFDPILTPSAKQVIVETAKRLSIPETHALAYVIMDYEAEGINVCMNAKLHMRVNPVDRNDPNAVEERMKLQDELGMVLDDIAGRAVTRLRDNGHRITKDEVKKALSERMETTMTECLKEENPMSCFRRHNAIGTHARDTAVTVSNEMSAKLTSEFLKKQRGLSSVLLFIGIAHKDVMTSVCK